MKRKMTALLAGAMFMLAAGSASAFTVYLSTSDGSFAATSSNTALNSVTYGNFTITLSDTIINSPSQSFQDQDVANVTYNGHATALNPVTLTLNFTELGFLLNVPTTDPNATALMYMGVGLNQNSVNYTSYFDNTNAGTNQTKIGSITLNSSFTSNTLTNGNLNIDPTNVNNGFSLSDIVTLTFTGSGQTVSADSSVDITPTPSPAPWCCSESACSASRFSASAA